MAGTQVRDGIPANRRIRSTGPEIMSTGYFGSLSSYYPSVPSKSMSDRFGIGGAKSKNETTIHLPPRSFSFRQRRGKLDTRAIAQIDLNRVIRETDIDTIQNQLENLAFSDITQQDFNQYSDEYFLKLFQIAQLTVEYLINVQESLVEHTAQLESQCEQIQSECNGLNDENDKIEEEVRHLKQEIKQKQNTIATYEMMLLTQQHRGKANPGEILPVAGNGGPVECILCNKKFLSTEYLLKHQKKKHINEASKIQDIKPSITVQEMPKEENLPEKKPQKEAHPGIEMAMVNSLISANTTILTKQIETLQSQLVHDKEERIHGTQLLQQQQQSFAEKVVDHMARMQDALKDMQQQAQHQREEWTQFAQNLLKKTSEKPRVEHIGSIVNDSEEQWRRDILMELKVQKEEERQRRLELEEERKQWGEREARLQQLLEQRQTEPILTQLLALEAHKHGIDYGIMSPSEQKINTPTHAVRNTLRDSQQQTDPMDAEKPKQRVQVIETAVMTDEYIPPVPKQIQARLDPPVKIPSTRNVKETPTKAIPQSSQKPTSIIPAQATDPTPLASIPKLEKAQSLKKPAISAEHQAATKLQKMASGYITRKHMNTPENWILRYNEEISIQITPQMTANLLRQMLAEQIGNIDPHRVLLHHIPSGSELVGNVLVFYTNGQMEVEIIPEHEIELNTNDYHEKLQRVQNLRLSTEPGADCTDNLDQVIRIQAVIRGFLATRRVNYMRIDRLVDLRLKKVNETQTSRSLSILHSPRDSSRALSLQTDKVQARLHEAVKIAHGGRPKKFMTQDMYETSMRQLEETRKKHPPELQKRISDMLNLVHDAAMKDFNPQVAKTNEIKDNAAVSIQSVIRVALAKKLVVQMTRKAEQEKEEFKEEDETKVDEEKQEETKQNASDEYIQSIEEFNQDESKSAGRIDSSDEIKQEYDDEKEILQAIKQDNEPSRISPFSTTALRSMKRRNSRGTMLNNAR